MGGVYYKAWFMITHPLAIIRYQNLSLKVINLTNFLDYLNHTLSLPVRCPVVQQSGEVRFTITPGLLNAY